jgi:phage regulator Rha-like protein|nr:MAG TPA: regulatory protein [Caudoviricetes sp.]
MTDIILSTQNGEPVASSRQIAESFDKRHDHVMRDIDDIIRGLPKNGDTPMFYKTEYTHEQNGQTAFDRTCAPARKLIDTRDAAIRG